MADTGINWSARAHATYSSGTDVDDIDLNDETTLTTDAIDLDGKAACQVSVKWIEGNDGACDGDVYVYVLGSDLDPDTEVWQTINDAIPAYTIDATQNATRIITFPVDPKKYSTFKILVDNDSGQDGDLTINYRTGTVPVAS